MITSVTFLFYPLDFVLFFDDEITKKNLTGIFAAEWMNITYSYGKLIQKF